MVSIEVNTFFDRLSTLANAYKLGVIKPEHNPIFTQLINDIVLEEFLLDSSLVKDGYRSSAYIQRIASTPLWKLIKEVRKYYLLCYKANEIWDDDVYFCMLLEHIATGYSSIDWINIHSHIIEVKS